MNKKSFLLAIFTVFLWASTFTGISMGLNGGYSSGHLLLMRFLTASLVFLIYAIFPGTKFRLPEKNDIPSLLFLAFVGIDIYHFGITFGEQTVSAGTTSMFIGSTPIFTALISIVFLKEKLSKVSWLGLFIGFIGIILITLGSSDSGFKISGGAILILISAISTSFFFVFQKPMLKKYKPIEFTAYVTWAGTFLFLFFSPGFINTVKYASLNATISAIYVGIFPAAIAYVTWAMALSSGKASAVSSMMYVEPVIAIIIARIFLNELPSRLSIIGGAIAISSIIIVNFLEKNLQKQ